VENLGLLGDVLREALATGGAASGLVQARLAQRWPRIRGLAMIADRYRDPQPHQFPAAVVFSW